MSGTDVFEIWFSDLTDTRQREIVNWWRANCSRCRAMSFTDVHEELSHASEPLARYWAEDFIVDGVDGS